MGVIQDKFDYKGNQYSIRIYQGMVTKTSQRSDTEVSGYGRTSIINGYGGGTTQISSELTVSTEIWVEIEANKELPFVLKEEISVREGQNVSVIEAVGNNIIGGKVITAIFNETVPELSVSVAPRIVLNSSKYSFFSGLTVLNIVITIIGIFFYILPGILYFAHVRNKWRISMDKKNSNEFVFEVTRQFRKITNKD